MRLRERISRRRRVAYALAAVLLSALLAMVAGVVADVFLHWATRNTAGINIWGYRGERVGAKQPGEMRVVMLGGSTVFGWPLPPQHSIPAALERQLNATPSATGRRFTVVNLGAPGDGASGFLFNLQDYAYLDYDVVMFYEGYNDVEEGRPNRSLWRQDSAVFRLTGYYPVFPLIFREKALAVAHGDLASLYRGHPERPASNRVGGALVYALNAAAVHGQKLERDIAGRLGSDAPVLPQTADSACRPAWTAYCGFVRDAARWALDQGSRVMVITQPYISDQHIEQQADLAAMLAARFGSDARLRYVNLGRAVDLQDTRVAFDGMHLEPGGNEHIAALLLPLLLELVP